MKRAVLLLLSILVAIGVAIPTATPVEATTETMTYLGMNVGAGPFADFTVRFAVYISLDRDDIAASQGGVKVVSIANPSTPNPLVNRPHDPDFAKNVLLPSAGYPDGFSTNLYTVPNMKHLANIIRDCLLQIGIDAAVVTLKPAVLFTELRNKTVPFFLIDTPVDNTTSPPEALGRLFMSDSLANYTGYNDPTFDALFNSGQYLDAEDRAFSPGDGLSIVPLFYRGTPFAQEGASIQTDKTVYLLGEPVVISGSGFTQGETTVTVLRPDDVVIAVPWLIWDDDVSFHTTHIPPRFLPFSPDYPDYTPGLIPGRYRVTATDGLNSAQTDYTVASARPKDRDVGRIVLVKQTVPDGAPDGFSFYIDYGAPFGYPNGLWMIDDASLDSGYILPPGQYTIDEFLIPEGWELSSIDIEDKSGGSYSEGTATTVDLAGGETVTVTYTNTRIGTTEAIRGVKVDLVEVLAEENPTPPPLFILSPGEVVGSVILNTTASGKLIANVNMDTEPGLENYDITVRVFYSNPPAPPATVVGILTDGLDTNATGQGNAQVVVEIDPPADIDSVFVTVVVREGPTNPPTPPDYFTGLLPVEVPLR